MQDKGTFEAPKEDHLRRPIYGHLRSTEGSLRPTEDLRKRANGPMNPTKRISLPNIRSGRKRHSKATGSSCQAANRRLSQMSPGRACLWWPSQVDPSHANISV